MDCWSILQLPDHADQRSIKRSYARLLKTTRPDEDAEGFQRLREAYEEALEIARWRDEDNASEPIPVAEPAISAEVPPQAELTSWSRLPELQPQPAPRIIEDKVPDLVAGLTAENLPQRWEQARQRDCATAFQQALLRLCFEQPGLRSSIAGWAVLELEWLTPWQAVRMSPEQEEALASGLLQEYRQSLQERLEAGQEREYLSLLTGYARQPWLRVFDRYQEWQQVVLQMLHATRWSLGLFERICQVFGWDESTGVIPEPAWMWQSLIARCEREGFFEDLQAKARNQQNGGPQQKAAYLMLTPLTPRQQAWRLRYFANSNWEACQLLSEKLGYQYPQLLERLPNPDVFFWRKFLPRPVPEHNWRLMWAALTMAIVLVLCLVDGQDQHRRGDQWLSIVLSPVIALIPVAISRLAMRLWVPISWQMVVADLWLSRYLIPRRVNPEHHWLVIRHGVPQLFLALLFLTWSGVLGMATYLGAVLIGLFDARRRGVERPQSLWRQPLQTALHFSGASPLQLGYVLIMLAVTIAGMVFYPELASTLGKSR